MLRREVRRAAAPAWRAAADTTCLRSAPAAQNAARVRARALAVGWWNSLVRELYICIYVCVGEYIYIYIYVYIYIYIYIYVSIYTYIHICIYIYVYIYLYIYVCVWVGVGVCVYMCIYINIYICIHIDKQIYMYRERVRESESYPHTLTRTHTPIYI